MVFSIIHVLHVYFLSAMESMDGINPSTPHGYERFKMFYANLFS